MTEQKLWSIRCRLVALSDLVKHAGDREPLVEEDEFYVGLGEIIAGIAHELLSDPSDT